MFKTFANDRRGSVAMIFGLSFVPAVMFVGAAIDLAKAINAKSELQTVVDIAATAGARLPATANENRAAAVTAAFSINAQGGSIANVTPSVSATNAEVQVSASMQVPTSFMGIIGVNSIEVAASASARSQIENGGVACLLALNENAPQGLHMQGINQFQSSNCWAWINSNGFESIDADGASSGRAQGFCTAGGVQGADHFSPYPYEACEPMADPFKTEISAPASTSCDYNNTQVRGETTISPGVYCGGLTIRPQATVTMQPGVYVIKNGELKVWAGSQLKGDNVAFYFTGTDTGIDVQGGASLDLRGRKDGSYGGFLFIQDWASNAGANVDIRGGGRLKMEGILYTPTWQVKIGGNGEVNADSQFWAMIADSFRMEGNGSLYIRSNAAAVGLPDRMPKIKTGPVILR